jgi:hypothetical protein
LALQTEEELDSGAVIRTSASKLENKRAPLRAQKSTGKRPRKKGLARKGRASLLPPEINVVTKTVQNLRFVVLSSPGTPAVVTYGAMLAALGAVGTVTNTTLSSIHSSYRIRKCTLWPSVATGAGANSLPEVEWLAGGTTEIAKDVSWNKTIPSGVTADPGAIVTVPSPGTLAGDWIYPAASASQVHMHFHNLTQGTVIDLLVEGTLRNNLSGVNVSVATAVLGNLYWTYPDAGNKIQPVGRPSTT